MNLKLIRTKQLNNTYSEIILNRNTKPFKPGYCIGFKNKDYLCSYLIASGLQEPWLRVIVHNDDPFYKDFQATYKKLDLVKCWDHLVPGPEYFLDLKIPETTFVVRGSGVSLALTYLSTYPNQKPKSIWYFEDQGVVNKEWLSKYNLIIPNKNEWPDSSENIVFCDSSRVDVKFT